MLLISEETDNKTIADSGTFLTTDSEQNQAKEVKPDTTTSPSSDQLTGTTTLNNPINHTIKSTTFQSRSSPLAASIQHNSMGKTTEEGGGVYTEREDEGEQRQAPGKSKALGCSRPDKALDEVTSGMKACMLIVRSQNDGEDDIVKHLEDLNLRETEGKEEPRKSVLKPQESDERGSEYDDDKESCDDNNELAETEDLATLERPLSEPSPGKEDRSPSEDEGVVLLERGGPDGGHPTTSHYNNHYGLDYSGLGCPQMPPSFPDYRNLLNCNSNNINNNFNNSAGCAKRTMDEQEVMFTSEPLKYTRPQQHQQQVPQQYQQLQQPEMMNNLNNPGCSGGAKQVVYQKQMSGGTVYTKENNFPVAAEPPVKGIMNQQRPELERQNTLDMLSFEYSTWPNLSADDVTWVTGEASEVEDTTPYAGQGGVMQQQQLQQQLIQQQQHQQHQQLPPVSTLLGSSQQSNMLIPNFMPPQQQLQQTMFTGSNGTNHVSSGDNLGFTSDKTEDSLDFESIDCSLLDKFLEGENKRLTEEDDDPTFIPLAGLSEDQTFPSLPSVEMFIGGPALQTGSNRSSYGSNEEDNGYISEMSPQHETDQSPAGSNHGLALSPPRSNLSMATVDSGVGSPMSEDGSIQGKSPRHISNCSPRHTSNSSPMQSGPFSPVGPQAQTIPTRSQVFPPPSQQAKDLLLPALLQNRTNNASFAAPYAPAPNAPAPALSGTTLYSTGPGLSPQQQMFVPPHTPYDGYMLGRLAMLSPTVAPSPQEVLANTNNGYHCNYLDDKKQELSDALEILDKDLEVQIKANRGGGLVAAASHNQSGCSQKLTPAPAAQVVPGNLPVTGTPQIPNLPTTVPVTISNPAVRPMTMSGKQRDGAAATVQQPAPVPNFQAGSTNPKVPIMPLRRPNQQTQRQQLQQVVLLNGSNLVPVYCAPIPAQKPRFPNIAPKPQGTTNTNISPASRGISGVNPCSNSSAVNRVPQNAGNIQGPLSSPPSSSSSVPTSVAPRPAQAATSNVAPAPPQAQIPNTNGKDLGLKESIKSTVLNNARRILSDWKTERILEADDEGDRYLHTAVFKGMAPLVVAILERLDRENLLAEANTQNNLGQTALYIAASTNQAKMVKFFIDYKADVNLFAENHCPSKAVIQLAAIHCICVKGEEFLPTLRALLSSPGINVDLVNSEGNTALHCAIISHGMPVGYNHKVNSIPIVQALLKAGANPDFQVQQSGKTALMLAIEYGHVDLLHAMCQLIDPAKLAAFFKTQAFNGSDCLKIAKSLKLRLPLPTTVNNNNNSSNSFNQQQQQQFPCASANNQVYSVKS